MSRQIDADNLFEKVGNIKPKNKSEYELIGKFMNMITNSPTVKRPHSEWIPCSERLPDLFEVVLVTDECGNVFEYERRPLDYDGNVCREWSFLSRNIIAWMPLPEPYKRGEAE